MSEGVVGSPGNGEEQRGGQGGPESDGGELDMRVGILEKLKEMFPEYKASLLTVYGGQKPSEELEAGGFRIPKGARVRTVRKPVDGAAKIGLRVVDGQVRVGGRKYDELDENKASVPESEISELLEAAGWGLGVDESGRAWVKQLDPEMRYLSVEALGLLVVLGELGDMANITAYTALALSNEGRKMKKAEGFGEDELGNQWGVVVDAVMNLDRLYVHKEGEEVTVLSLLPEEISGILGGLSEDERMQLMLALAQAKMWASADRGNLRLQDQDKLRKSSPSAKMAILLVEQELMSENLKKLIDEEKIPSQVVDRVIKIIEESAGKRQEIKKKVREEWVDGLGLEGGFGEGLETDSSEWVSRDGDEFAGKVLEELGVGCEEGREGRWLAWLDGKIRGELVGSDDFK